MKAFVTGGTGFVGSHLVDALLARGAEVTVLARAPSKAARLFGEGRVRVVPGDLGTPEALRRGCEGVELVFHVAGLIAARRPADFYLVNRDHTRLLLEIAAAAAPGLRRFLYVSTLSAAGPARRGIPTIESDAPHPVNHYGRSKLAAEDAVRASGLSWTIVRPPTVYGPRDREVLRVFRLARLGVLPVVGDPAQELSFIYGADLATALVAATGPDTAGKVYHATHPEVVTAEAVARAIYRAVRDGTRGPRLPFPANPWLIPIPAPVARGALWITGMAARLAGRATLLSPDKAAEFLADAWTCSADAIQADTGWTAKTNLASGLSLTATWYRQHGWL